MSRTRRFALLVFAIGGLAGLVFLALQVETEPAEACPVPAPDSREGRLLQSVRAEAVFPVLYPCTLPLSQKLESATVIGNPGRQSVTLVFSGPFDLTVRQSQFPPAFNPDPAGVSRSRLDLFPDTRAVFLERNDGSPRAQYHILWDRNGIYYEVQAIGPPLQKRQIIAVATSLELK